ncbi:hypothetical protein BGX30_005710 [Mortierella sp. GBA39]|nr:hypothetical protein BGX30_005710 [Mortierella sp. GBA39]
MMKIQGGSKRAGVDTMLRDYLAKRFASKGTVYWRSIALAILLTCIPITIVSCIGGYVGNRYLIQQYQQNNEIMLRESVRRIDGQFAQLQNVLLQPLLGLRTLDDPADRAVWNSLMNGDKGIFWTNHLTRPFGRSGSKHAIVMKLPFNGQTSYGALVLYVNPAMLQLNVTPDQAAYVLDGSDVVIGQSDAAKSYPELLPRIMEQLGSTKRTYDSQSRFQIRADHEQFLMNAVSFEKMNRIWTFVTGTPSSKVTAPNSAYTHVVVVYWMVSLIAALGLSWFASNRFYQPFRKVMDLVRDGKADEDAHPSDEMAYIEAKWQQYRFANESLQSRLDQSTPKVREALINQFAPLTEKDSQLITYAAINIVGEMSEASAAYVHTLDLLDGSIAAVLIFPETSAMDDARDELLRLGGDMLRTLEHVLSMPSTIVVNGPASLWMDIPYLLEQSRKALSYRTFTSESQLLDATAVLEQANPEVDFPYDLEQEFTHTLNLGLEREAADILERFVTALKNEGAPEWVVHQGLMRLKSSLYRSMLQSGHNPYALFDGVQLEEELRTLRDAEACIQWFGKRVIRPYIDMLSKSYQHAMKDIVDQVLATIHDNYMCDISLETFAMEAGVSVSHLSKAFRQMTGSNYIDYLTALKIGRCKKLLLTTDLKMNEIAKSVGYQPPYFNRMFKKLEGMTPGQYRLQFSETKLGKAE